jgi:hypothetical protein
MIPRRRMLALLAWFGAAACGGSRGVVAPEPTQEPALALEPIVDLVPAAGLVWLVEARPRDLLASPVLATAIATLVPADRFDTFARRHGAVDLRQASQIAVAGYGRSILGLARVQIEPYRVESAFAARATIVEGRAAERGVSRLWGRVGDQGEQVAVFGRSGVGVERGAFGPLRAAIYFAEGKLKRARPSLRAEPLAAAEKLVGDSPLRWFAPGPFEGEWAAGLGGLLRATTAVAATLRAPAEGMAGTIAIRIVLTGAWGSDAQAAADRLAASFRVLASDPLGRLTGVDHPIDGPRVTGDAGALQLDVVVDPVALSRGLNAATDASIAEIMAF